MDFLPDASERRTVTKSSISQARNNKFSTTNQLGQFFPLVFDVLDYIDCTKITSHRAVVSMTDELDYEYPVRECTYYTDKYVYVDEQETELRTLPHWFGEGFYQAYIDQNQFVNFDDQAFGTRNKHTLQTGLHYVSALDTLE